MRIIKIKLLFVIMFFISLTYVSAIDVGSNIGGGVVGSYSSCGTGFPSICWNDIAKSKTAITQAVRITIVDNSGTILPGTRSHDFFKAEGTFKGFNNNTLAENYLSKKNVNFYLNKHYKNEVLKFPGNWKDWTTDANKSFKDGGNYTLLTNNSFPNFIGVSGGGTALRNYFVNIDEDFFKENYLKKLGFDYETERNKLLTDPNYFNNIALLIEPLIWFRLTFDRSESNRFTIDYAGTATEVARMLNSSASKEPGYTGSDVFFDLIQKYKKVDGKSVVASYRGSHFPSTSFNDRFPLSIYCDTSETKAGLHGIRHWVLSNYSDNYAGELLTTNCVAAGHVWFNEILKEKGCEDLEFAKNNIPSCCKVLYNIHHKNGSINIRDYLSTTGVSCCGELKDIIPNSWYERDCVIEVNDCDYKFEVDCTDNCYNNTEGFVKDIGINGDMNDWKCIFESTKSSVPLKAREHYKWTGFGYNPYCEVYCREEITYKFPRNGMNVLAGHHFLVGERVGNSWFPIEFDGVQECRTKGDGDKKIINHVQFAKDWKYYNDRLPSLWRTYQLERARDNSRNNAKRASSRNCDYYCDHNVHGITCCIEADRDWDSCKYGSPNACVGGVGADGKYNPCASTRNTCSGGWGPWYCVNDDTPYDHGYWMTPPPEYHGVFGPVTERGWCTTNGSGREPTKPTSSTASARSSYNSVKSSRDALLPYINRCNDWARDYNSFKPEIYLEYEEDLYGFNFTSLPISKLKANLVIDNKNKTYYSGSNYDVQIPYSTDYVARYDCYEGEYCEDNDQIYPINDNRDEVYYKRYEYSLENNVYRYISKPPGVSHHFISDIPGNYQYVDMGHSGLPVHFSRLEGKYDISLKYTSFGFNNKFNRYILDSSNLAFPYDYANYYNCEQVYECDYNVSNYFMYCTHDKCKDIQIVFRPISLSNPFPGKGGNGRIPGSNWRFHENKITNNRNLSAPEKIYFDREPMYEINLNSGSILSIRKYNRTTARGYADFKLNCLSGQGKECKSEFIREKFRDYFNLSRCGMSSNWDLCFENDKRG